MRRFIQLIEHAHFSTIFNRLASRKLFIIEFSNIHWLLRLDSDLLTDASETFAID